MPDTLRLGNNEGWKFDIEKNLRRDGETRDPLWLRLDGDDNGFEWGRKVTFELDLADALWLQSLVTTHRSRMQYERINFRGKQDSKEYETVLQKSRRWSRIATTLFTILKGSVKYSDHKIRESAGQQAKDLGRFRR